MSTTVPLSRALIDDQWDRIRRSGLTLSLDGHQRCVIRDRDGRVGIGRSPAQALDDYDGSR
jgi:hypothetical protein